MKIKLVSTLILLSSLQFVAKAQLSGFGINGKVNASRHFINDLNLEPKFAYSVTDILPTAGEGIFADWKLNNRWKLRGNINYDTKGLAVRYTAVDGPRADKFKFNMLSADARIVMNIGNGESIRPYFTAGLSASYLLNVKLDTWQYEIFGEDAYKQEFGYQYYDYAKLSLSGLVGFGLSIKEVVWLETTYNHDILAPINRSNLKVYNRLWSANVGVNILELVRLSKK